MNKLELLISKICVLIFIILMFIDSFVGQIVPSVAYMVPLLIIGSVRGFIILLILIVNLLIYSRDAGKKIIKKVKK